MNWRLLLVEMIASVTTITGIWYGSTTLLGALLYAAGVPFWYWLTVARKAWGLMPLNVLTTLAIARNLWTLAQ